MSSECIDRMVVIRIAKEQTGDYNDSFLWIIEAGSSNCFESRTGRRSRSWQCAAIGHHYRVVRQVCEVAGDCEGGMVKYPGGRDCKPETLIRAYRNAEAQAFDGFEAALNAGMNVTLRIRFQTKDRDRTAQYHYDELVKAGKMIVRESLPYGGECDVAYFSKDSKADLLLWLRHSHDAGWNNCEVTGPRGELRRSVAVPVAACHEDYGGAFDGFTVTSDADAGL